MRKEVKLIFVFLLAVSFGFTMTKVNAETNYINYNNISISDSEYDTLLNLGFTENEIYYMDYQTYLNNKDLDATLVAQTEKYYKTSYLGTAITSNVRTEVLTKEEYENERMNEQNGARGYVTTEYKHMVSSISSNGSLYRYKVTLNWLKIPSTKSYDIIGVGFDSQNDNIYIDSVVYFGYTYRVSGGSSTSSTQYYDRKRLYTGSSVTYKLPSQSLSELSSYLYYDVGKLSGTVTTQSICGDYAHATANVTASYTANHTINQNGLTLYSLIVDDYDEIPCAPASWSGTW